MSYFLWNVLLAFVWATLTGQFTLGTVAMGFVVVIVGAMAQG